MPLLRLFVKRERNWGYDREGRVKPRAGRARGQFVIGLAASTKETSAHTPGPSLQRRHFGHLIVELGEVVVLWTGHELHRAARVLVEDAGDKVGDVISPLD